MRPDAHVSLSGRNCTIKGRDFFAYAIGYKSAEIAAEKVSSLYAEAEISPCDDPHVIGYSTPSGVTRYGVAIRA